MKPLRVESDGDRVPKDVYIIDDEESERIATMEGHNETRMFANARRLVRGANQLEIAVSALEKCRDLLTLSDVRCFCCTSEGLNRETLYRLAVDSTIAALRKGKDK